MARYIDHSMRLNSLFLFSPAVFLVHDAEEIVTMERFWRENRDRVPLPLGIKDRMQATMPQMAAAVTFITVLSCLASWPAVRSRNPGWRIDLFGTMLSVRFANVLWHLLQTLILRRYTPGAITALTVVLPLTLYLFHRLCKEDLATTRVLIRCLRFGALLHTPLVLAAQVAGKAAVRLLPWGS